MFGWSFESGVNQGTTISNIEQGMMNVEGKNKIDEPVLQTKGPLILPFIIRSSLFDIRYSFLSWRSARSKICRISDDQIDISQPAPTKPAVFNLTLPLLPLRGCRGGSAKKVRKPGPENRWLCRWSLTDRRLRIACALS
jgi:hypothetical protein